MPPGYFSTSRGGSGCGFTGPGFGCDLSVSVGPMPSLLQVKERQVDPFEDIGGDDEVNDIRYRTGVPGLGGQPAEELTWRVYNDGLPFWEIAVQAAGVRLTWSRSAISTSRSRMPGAMRSVSSSLRSWA